MEQVWRQKWYSPPGRAGSSPLWASVRGGACVVSKGSRVLVLLQLCLDAGYTWPHLPPSAGTCDTRDPCVPAQLPACCIGGHGLLLPSPSPTMEVLGRSPRSPALPLRCHVSQDLCPPCLLPAACSWPSVFTLPRPRVLQRDWPQLSSPTQGRAPGSCAPCGLACVTQLSRHTPHLWCAPCRGPGISDHLHGLE